MRYLLPLLLLAGLSACSLPDVKLYEDEIRDLYVGNTVAYGEPGDRAYEYHSAFGFIEFIGYDGRRYTGRYTIREDQICYRYNNYPGSSCWETLTTDELGVYGVREAGYESEYLRPMIVVGEGDRISLTGNYSRRR